MVKWIITDTGNSEQRWRLHTDRNKKEPKMSETIIYTTKENILKTHQEGCSATKKALENLYPEVFVTPKIQGPDVDKHYAIVNGVLLMSPQLSKQLEFDGWSVKYEGIDLREILSFPYFTNWVGQYMDEYEIKDWLEKIIKLHDYET